MPNTTASEKPASAMNVSDPNSWDLLLYNAQVLTMQSKSDSLLQPIDNGAIGIKGQQVVWLGKTKDLPVNAQQQVTRAIDCKQKIVTPGLIDCHTHLIYGGDRAKEFELRLNGASYEEIAKQGGGIVSTVKATRMACEQDLLASATKRISNFLNEGVTTVEIKSGYGLNTANEMKMLRVARMLGEQENVDVVTTFLGAHTTPLEYKGREDEYIQLVVEKMLPAIASAGLADAVDAFCENIAFTTEQTQRVFDAAKAHSLPIKLHAEQLSDSKGSVLAAKYGALSVDHLEFLAPDDVAVLAQNSTVAVLLPGAYYFLRETKLPPIEALREHGIDIAIASDSNPGSSPVLSLLLMLNMACTLFRLTPEEALAGVTINAAKALGIDTSVGSIASNKIANLVLWDADNVAQLCYPMGGNPCQHVIYRGKLQ